MTVNKQNIVKYDKDASDVINGFIMTETKNSIISLKLDTTSKMHRSEMPVSVQFYKDLTFIRRSLGK